MLSFRHLSLNFSYRVSSEAILVFSQATDKLQDRASQGTMFEQARDSTLPCYGAANDNSDSSRGQWCKVVLEQIDQSLNEGGGLLGCIRKAIQHSTDTDNTKIKVSGTLYCHLFWSCL